MGGLVEKSGLAELLGLQGDLQKDQEMYDSNAILLGGLVFLRHVLSGPHAQENAAKFQQKGEEIFEEDKRRDADAETPSDAANNP
jgi:hypothetical protein